MNTEEQFHNNRIKVIQARFPGTQDTILALQKEYNEALDDFRRWAKDNPCPILKEEIKTESNLVLHKIEWIGPRQIKII